jgi:rhamnogalacturonyl hydrolase YesR
MASPALVLPGFDAHLFDSTSYYYCLPQSKTYNSEISFSCGVYSTFGWKYLGMETKYPLELKFKKPTKKIKNLVFRFTSSIWQAERFRIELYLLKSHKIINSTEVWNPYFLQPFEIEIDSSFFDPVFEEGIGVRPVGQKESFFIFSDTDENIPVQFRPSLLCFKDAPSRRNEVVKRLADDSSLQFFGWPEGCLWDGIFDLGESSAKFDSSFIIQRRLKHFLDENNKLDYVVTDNRKITNAIYNVETVLPFGILAKIKPDHPLVWQAVDFCKSQINSAGIITHKDGNELKIKTEENYTVSYPLLVIAKNTGDHSLADIAVSNLLYRKKLLSTENGVFHRKIGSDNPVYLNWARGTAWYLLGLAKSIKLIPPAHPKYNELVEEFQLAASRVVSHINPDGMFYAFLHDKTTTLDTSGTAGIVAAFAYGVKNNFLSEVHYSDVIRKSINEMVKSYLTPDGYLRGSTQINNGGEILQRSKFRTISPYTLGFIGIILSCGY